MNENYVYIVDYPGEKNKKTFKERVSSMAHKTKDWFVRNQEIIIPIIPACIAGIVSVVKITGKHANLRKEENVKNLYCYDRSLGHYWALRRELTNTEWLEIDRRKRNGERLADILAEFKVLK